MRNFLLKALALLATLSLLFPGLTPVLAADSADEFGPLKKISSATAASLGLTSSLWHIAFDNSGGAYVIGNNADNKSRKIVKVDPATGTKVTDIELGSDIAADVQIRDIAFVPKFLAADGTTELENILVAALKPANNGNGLAYVKLTADGFDTAGFTFINTADNNNSGSSIGRDSVNYYGETLSYSSPQPPLIIAGVNDRGSSSNQSRITIYRADAGFQIPTTKGGPSYARPFGNGLAYVGYLENGGTRNKVGKFDWNSADNNWNNQADKETFRDSKADAYTQNDKRYRPYKSVNDSMRYGMYGARWNGFGAISVEGGVSYITGQFFDNSGSTLTAYAFLAPDSDGNYGALAGVKKSDGAFISWRNFSAISNNVSGNNNNADPLSSSSAWADTQKIGDAGRDILDIKVAPNGVVGVVKDDEVIFYDQKPDKAKVSDVQVVRKADGSVRPVTPKVRGSRLTFSAGADKPATLNLNTTTGEVTGTLGAEEKGSFKVTVTGAGVAAMEVTYYYGPVTEGVDPSSTSVTFTQIGSARSESEIVPELWAAQYPKPYVDISYPANGATNSLPEGLTFEPGSGKISGVLAVGEHSPLVLLADNLLKGTPQTVTVSFGRTQEIRYKPSGSAEFTAELTAPEVTAYSGFTYSTDNPIAVLPAGDWEVKGYSMQWSMVGNGEIPAIANSDHTLIGTANPAATGTYLVTLQALLSGNSPVIDGTTYYTPFTLIYPVAVKEALLSPYKKDVTVGASITSAAVLPASLAGAVYSANTTDLVAPGAGLPKGLTLAADGVLDGTIAEEVATGIYTPTVSMVLQGNTVTAVYSLLVRADLTLAAKIAEVAPGAALADMAADITGGPVTAYELLATEAKAVAAADAPTAAYPSGLTLNTDTGVLGGQVAEDVAEGVYTFGVKALGSSVEEPAQTYSATALYTLVVSKPRAVSAVNTAATPGAEVAVPVTATGLFTAWSLEPEVAGEGKLTGTAAAAGAGLPKGVVFDPANGSLGGNLAADAAIGVYTFTIKAYGPSVSDGAVVTASAAGVYQFTVLQAPQITGQSKDLAIGAELTLSASPAAADGWVYAADATDVVAPGAGLPKGLTLDADSGVITGAVANEAGLGIYTAVVTVSAAAANVSTSATYTLLVRKDLTLAARSFGAAPGVALAGVTPDLTGGPAASYELLGAAAAAPAADAYPSGLTLNTDSGVIGGQVDVEAAEGAYTFAVKVIGKSVENQNYTATALYTVTVAKVIKVTDSAYAVAAGQSVNITPAYEGAPTIWEGPAAVDAPGAGLPKGLTLDTDSGVIAGEVAADAAVGVYTVLLTAKGQTYNAAGELVDASALGTMLITVSAAPEISAVTSTVIAGTQVTITPAPAASAGWSYTAVGLPEGWNIDPDSGVVNGLVEADAEFTVRVVATAMTEGDLPSAEAVYRFNTIAKVAFDADDAALLVKPGEQVNLPLDYEGTPTSFLITDATKGSAPGANVYPADVTVNESGIVTGVIAADVKAGEYVFTVRAAGAPEGNTDTMVITINVTTDPTPDTPEKPAGDSADGDSADGDSADGGPAGDSGSEKGESAGDSAAGDSGSKVDPAGDNAGSGAGDSGAGDSGAGDSGADSTTDPVAPGAEVSVPAPADLPEGAKEFAAENPAGTEPAAGVMPSGLTVDPADGSVKGLVADNVKPGKYTFPVVYKDADGKLKTTSYTVTVDPKPSSVATVGGDASIPAPVDVPAGASGFGFGPGVSYATTPGSGGVPAVLFLGEDGSLSGKVGDDVQPGEHTFPVTYTDANGKVQTTNYTVTVAPKDAASDKGGDSAGSAGGDSSNAGDAADKPKVKPTPGGSASIPAPTDAPEGASKFGFGPGVSYATTPGSGGVPAVLFLAEDGSLSGKVTDSVQPGEYTFPVTYTDADGNVQTTNLTVTVAPKGSEPGAGDSAGNTGDNAGGDSAAGNAGGSAGDKGGDSAPVVTVAEPVQAVITQNQLTSVAGPAGAVSYSFAPGAAYGTEPGVNAVPSVLFLNADNGTLQGIVKGATGIYSFMVDMTKADGSINRVPYRITVVPSAAVAVPVDAVITQSQLTTIAGVPGATAYSFAAGVAYGAAPGENVVPAVLFLNQQDGSLFGAVKAATGVYSFPVDATKADGSTTRVLYRFTVVPSASSAPTIEAVITQNEVTTIAGVPGAVSYSFAPGVAYGAEPGANAVPSVLFLNAENGTLQGIVKGATGVYTFAIDATQTNGIVKRVLYRVTVVSKAES